MATNPITVNGKQYWLIKNKNGRKSVCESLPNGELKPVHAAERQAVLRSLGLIS